jgi:hypothetical protein
MARRKVSDEDVVDILLEEYPSDVDTPYEDSSDESEEDCYELQQQQHCDTPGPSTSGTQQNASSVSSEESGDEETNSRPVTRNFRKRDIVTTVPIFTLQDGIVQQFFAGKTCPTDVFLTVLSENIICDLIFQSNLYIQQKQRHIQPITEQEFCGFLGLPWLPSPTSKSPLLV